VAAITPGPAASWTAQLCHRAHCEGAGTVRWARQLPGTWLAQGGLTGTAPAGGQAFAALSTQAAVVGTGLTVYAYSAHDGQPLWTDNLTGFPAGSEIVSVRAWPGVVTVGVALPAPAGATPRARAARRAGGLRSEVVLSESSGRRLGVHPAAAFGGAVAAGPGATVILGGRAVTSYSNHTGKMLWSRPTGLVPQAWQVDGARLYVTVAANGYLGTAPVTALRRIDLRTGGQRLVRPPGHAFAGTLSLAFAGVVLFSDAQGITAYSGTTGELLWRRGRALPDAVDATYRRIYLINGDKLLGVNPVTGAVITRVPGAGATATGLYAVREGAVLGLDHGAVGKAWGYNIATRRVVWTSRTLPWPHYFVDLSGIGGSAPPDVAAVLLATCARLGMQLPGNAGQQCPRPELVVLNR
jgi:outer membrane protein assembly factor BamB